MPQGEYSLHTSGPRGKLPGVGITCIPVHQLEPHFCLIKGLSGDSPKSMRFTGAMSSSYWPIVFCIDQAKKSSCQPFRAGSCFAEAQHGQRQGASDPGRFSHVYQDR